MLDLPSVLHIDAERGFSGGEVQVFLLMEGLRKLGWRQALACPPNSAAEAHALGRGFDVFRVPMDSDLALLAPVRLAAAARRFGADLVHLHTGRATWLGGLGALLAGVPALTTRRMDRRVRRGWRTRLVHERLTKRTVAISPAVAQCLAEGGVPQDRVRTIWSSIDPARVRAARGRDEVRIELDVGAGDVLAVSLGTLIRRKGFDVLVEAAARAARPELVVAIAGEGPEREALAERARATGVRLLLLGRREDVGDLLAAAELSVLPSRREGLGVAALEAMAAGRALLATRVGGLGEAVVDGQSGLLVPADDADALGTALARLVADPALRARLGAGGVARVRERFLAAHMVAAYEALYRELLDER